MAAEHVRGQLGLQDTMFGGRIYKIKHYVINTRNFDLYVTLYIFTRYC